ncbi:MAG: hypothetical protein QOJ32_577, partial [Frankiaceae bacterium]|nr:hypothetical protein [Frankiaceae bacterium]
CAGYFLVVSIAAVSPPRLRVPLDVLFVLGTATVLAAGWQRWRAHPHSDSTGALP